MRKLKFISKFKNLKRKAFGEIGIFLILRLSRILFLPELPSSKKYIERLFYFKYYNMDIKQKVMGKALD